MMAKYLATSLAIEKVVSEPRVIRSCLPISTISMSLVGIGVEIDHVAGLARGLGAGLHGDADIGLRQRRRVIGAVAAHGDEPALGLLGADVGELVLGRRLGDEVVDAGLGGDRRGGDRIVAGHHHGLDAHGAQGVEALLDVGLDHVLEVDDAEQLAVLGDGERRAAGARDPVDRLAEGVRRRICGDRCACFRMASTAPLRMMRVAEIDAGDARHGREGDERCAFGRAEHRARRPYVASGQRHDRAAFRRLVGERGEQRRLGQFRFA